MESGLVHASGSVLRKARTSLSNTLIADSVDAIWGAGMRSIRAPLGAERRLLGGHPRVRICPGQQCAGLECGPDAVKLTFWHGGATNPLQGLRTGGVLVTVRSHGSAVSASDGELVTHLSLNDGTVEG